MRRHFSAVYVHGLDQLAPAKPMIIYASHSAWWDSLICFDLVYRTLKRDGYALMDERSFGKVTFLRWIGGFGVRIGDKEDGVRALEYASALLRQPRIVVMFPQGKERPLAARPLDFKPGLGRLAEMTGVATLPMVIRYEHGRDERPFALVSIGKDDKQFERAMEDRLRFVEASLNDGTYLRWHPYLPPRQSRWVGANGEVIRKTS